METKFEHIVYHKSVLEFTAIANEYCHFVEQTSVLSKTEFMSKTQKLLSFLYFKALLLPQTQNIYEQELEQFVDEHDWTFVKNAVATKMGVHDEFFYVYENQDESEINISLSESMADIYQDMKQFSVAYEIGTEETMNEALWKCKLNFEQYWGQRIIGVLETLHRIAFGTELLEAEDDDNNNSILDSDEPLTTNRDTSSWIVTRRQKDWQEDNF